MHHSYEGLDRPGALGHSMLSTHPVLTVEGGRFASPLESPEAESVNTFPVLATDEDDALLGAAIMLPDHPRLDLDPGSGDRKIGAQHAERDRFVHPVTPAS